MFEAAFGPEENMIQPFIDAGADVNITDTLYRKTPLGIARKRYNFFCSKNDPETAKRFQSVINALLKAGARESVIEYANLAEAVKAQDIIAVKRMVKAGANVNQLLPNDIFPTLLFVSRSEEMIRTLAELGADVNAKNSWGATPLFMAAFGTAEWEIQPLIDAGADVNIPDSLHNLTPLQMARKVIADFRGKDSDRVERSQKIVEMLLRAGASESPSNTQTSRSTSNRTSRTEDNVDKDAAAKA
ncbi:MAG: hypothetical protein Q4G69_13920, partial [Planctomycetia bacterium]|nr:hypothetical protein [Planctomycetia bacterium]